MCVCVCVCVCTSAVVAQQLRQLETFRHWSGPEDAVSIESAVAAARFIVREIM
jgi:hypothetical protein